jgi:exopolyphosphatase/guanosine-5'-triphosphate,3'-diphosphate pyrophosphatase
MMERPVEELLSHIGTGETLQLVGTSGTILTLAEIHAREKLGEVPLSLHGYQFSLRDLRDMINRLRRLNYAERAAIPGMSDRRSEIILAGAMILQETMALLGVDTMTICGLDADSRLD